MKNWRLWLKVILGILTLGTSVVAGALIQRRTARKTQGYDPDTTEIIRRDVERSVDAIEGRTEDRVAAIEKEREDGREALERDTEKRREELTDDDDARTGAASDLARKLADRRRNRS